MPRHISGPIQDLLSHRATSPGKPNERSTRGRRILAHAASTSCAFSPPCQAALSPPASGHGPAGVRRAPIAHPLRHLPLPRPPAISCTPRAEITSVSCCEKGSDARRPATAGSLPAEGFPTARRREQGWPAQALVPPVRCPRVTPATCRATSIGGARAATPAVRSACPRAQRPQASAGGA